MYKFYKNIIVLAVHILIFIKIMTLTFKADKLKFLITGIFVANFSSISINKITNRFLVYKTSLR